MKNFSKFNQKICRWLTRKFSNQKICRLLLKFGSKSFHKTRQLMIIVKNLIKILSLIADKLCNI